MEGGKNTFMKKDFDKVMAGPCCNYMSALRGEIFTAFEHDLWDVL